MITIVCAECGQGHYYAGRDLSTGRSLWAVCDECGHEVAEADLTLDEGEAVAWDEEGRLAYTTH